MDEEESTCRRAPFTLNLAPTSEGGCRINDSEGCFGGLVSFPDGQIILLLE